MPNVPLIERINRRLVHEGEQLRRSRTWTSDTGDFDVVDLHRNSIVVAHVDPEQLARQLGVSSDTEVEAK
jgi:hypothetical protein